MSVEGIHKHFLFALRRALRCIARMLIRAGIRFDEFANVVRSVYIEAAIRDCSHPTLPSRARIAALTGLPIRAVDRHVDDQGGMPSAAPTLMSTVVQVLQKWHTVPEYVGPYGIPRELEFSAPRDRCFCSLVALVDQRANPRDALDELLRAGAVVTSGKTHLRAVSRSLMLDEAMSAELIEYYGRGMSRLAATLAHNFDSVKPRLLARRVVADRGLPIALVPAFEKYARSKAADFLLDLDNWLASQAPNDLDSADRVDVGIYVFSYSERASIDEPLNRLVKP